MMSLGCGLSYLFSQPPSLQLGGVCSLRGNVGSVCVRPDGVCGREELTRLELVQRLAKDGCRLLQNQNYRVPDHRNPTVSTHTHTHKVWCYPDVYSFIRFLYHTRVYGAHKGRYLFPNIKNPRIQYSIPPKPNSYCKMSMFIQYMSLSQVSEKGIMPCLFSKQPEVRH